MLIVDRQNRNSTALDALALADVSITERYGIQEFICNSPDAFFKEISHELFLIGKEVLPSKNVQDRIDVLALDKEGCCVIVELKRGNHKLHMFQAISYAGMISQWSRDDFRNLLDEKRQEELADFLDVDKDDINRQQRIILVAEAYDYSLLIGAEWFSERFGVDVAFWTIAVAKDTMTDSEYLVCSNVYPAPELAHEAVARGRKGSTTSKVKWFTWEQALETVTNSDLITFFQHELEANQESYLRKRVLRYRIAGKKRWFMAARKERAYVWQYGRFDDDLEFCRNGLSEPNEVKPVKDNTCWVCFYASPRTSITSRTLSRKLSGL